MEKQLVSIISPCFNGERFLTPFLNSVIAQTYRPIELVFIDDGSTDRTKDQFDSFSDRFCNALIDAKYYRQKHAGAAAAINVGLRHVSGEFIMWVDSDDILTEGNVEEKVRFLETHSECGFVLAEGVLVNYPDLDTPSGTLKREKPTGKDDFFSDLIYERNIVFGPGLILARAEALRNALPKEGIYESRQGQNWQLMLPLAYTSRCGYLERTLLKCVSHTDSHSRTQRTYRQLIERQEEFFDLLSATIDRIVQMPQSEKRLWRRRVHIKVDTSILQLASDHNDPLRYFIAMLRIKARGGRVPRGGRRLFGILRANVKKCFRKGRK